MFPLCSSTRAKPLKIITTARLSVHTLIASNDAFKTSTRPFIQSLILRERLRQCQNLYLLGSGSVCFLPHSHRGFSPVTDGVPRHLEPFQRFGFLPFSASQTVKTVGRNQGA